MPPLSLYVHLPWCVRKCPYCDFNSYGLKGELPEKEYLEALERDLAAQAPAAAGRPILSVFFGGGTPSLFTPAAIGRVLETARGLLTFESGAEITLEANPGTIERGRFAEYRSAGVNRCRSAPRASMRGSSSPSGASTPQGIPASPPRSCTPRDS